MVAAYGSHFRHIFAQPACRILDLCCGTGDMTFALRKQACKEGKRQLANFGSRFLSCHAAAGSSKSHGQNATSAGITPRWIEADALSLPFPDEHFNLVTSAFGFRNLADYDAGLREIVACAEAGRRVRHP